MIVISENIHFVAKRKFTTARNIFNRVKNDQSRINFTRARTKYNHMKRKAMEKFIRSEGNRLNGLAKKGCTKILAKVLKRHIKRHILYQII